MVLALDPTIKLEYAKNNWDSEAYHAGYAAFKKVVWIFRADPSHFIIYLLQFAEYYEATTDATPALTTELPGKILPP